MVIGGAAVFPIVLYLYISLRRVGYPFELAWLEGGAAEIVNRLVHGQAMYAQPSLHYVAYPYTPLYFWLSAGLAKVIGVGFLPLRLVSLVASVGNFVLLFHLVRRETGQRLAGLAAAGLFAATYDVSGTSFDLARVDSLFLFFLLAAVVVARKAERARTGVLIGFLIFASFFTKQTALLAAAPMLGYLLVARRRVGVAAVGSLVFLLVVSTLVLNAQSHGWYGYFVFQELVHSGINHKVLHTFIPRDLLRPTGWAVALALAGLVWWAIRGRPAGSWLFWIVAAAGLVGASWISLIHSGGAGNVLAPAYAGLALCAGLGLAELRRVPNRYQLVVSVVLSVAVVAQVAQLYRQPQRHIPSAQSEAAGHQFIAYLRHLPGPVIVLDHPWYATQAGRAAWAQGDAVHDVLSGGPSSARTDLLRSIHSVITSPGVNYVIGDTPNEGIGRSFTRYFRAGPAIFHCAHCFYTVSDIPRRPSYLNIRR